MIRSALVKRAAFRHAYSTSAAPPSFAGTFDAYKVETSVPRLSQHLIPALQQACEDPLVRHGYARQVAAGSYHLLPLGHMVQTNIANLARRHMVAVGGAEVSLSSLSNPALWAKTGRGANPELFTVGAEQQYILAPTHEEEITSLVASGIAASRKRLPLRLFQVSRKYRNEKRPRGGLLRAREFLMKDMYSFDATPEDAHRTYEEMSAAYRAFFGDLGVPFVVAEADSGAIGGSLSHEYHHLSPVGEDKVVTCHECKYTANVEKAQAFPPEAEHGALAGDTTAAVRYFLSADRATLVAAYYPPDREFNVLHLLAELPEDTIDGEAAHDGEEVAREFADCAQQDDDEGLFTRRLIRVMDPRLSRETPLPALPFRANKGTTTTLVDVPLVMARSGDLCPSCDDGVTPLTVARAVEVGHTFYLGTRYSAPLGATARDPAAGGAPVAVEMGCYGVGVSRLLAAIASTTTDVDGLAWPAAVAPYHVVVVAAQPAAAQQIVARLRADGVNAVWDDRADVSFGAALRDARALGFPATVVAGKHYEQTGRAEIQLRGMSVAEIKENRGSQEFLSPLNGLSAKIRLLLNL